MVVVTGTTDARANDPVAADAMFQAGKQSIAEKKYAEACAKFDASYKLDPTLGTLLNLADCYEKAGRFATSWETWGAAIEQAQRDKDPRVDYAKERRENLTPKLPKVVIRAYGMMPGIDVLWDGSKLPPGAFGTDMPTDLLEHKLVVRRDDGVVLLEQNVRVREDGTKTEVPIDVVALNRAHPRRLSEGAPSSSAPRSSQSSAGLVIGGVGLAAILTAAGLELGALVKRNEANDADACVYNFCTPQGIDAIASARTYAEAGQWIGLGGLVVFSVGATLLFAAPSAPAASSTSTPHASNVRRQTVRHPQILSPSSVWWSPWAGPAGGGIVVGGAL
jgi:tetratricopeptide (TPR) repeat protein